MDYLLNVVNIEKLQQVLSDFLFYLFEEWNIKFGKQVLDRLIESFSLRDL